jgi:hypothetical protein
MRSADGRSDPKLSVGQQTRCAGSDRRRFTTTTFESDLVIVDVSSWNPNVFYELGIRHRRKNPVR